MVGNTQLLIFYLILGVTVLQNEIYANFFKSNVYHSPLDTSATTELLWKIANKTLLFEVCSQKVEQQVFGFGFSNYGEVTGADILLIWKTFGKWHYGDFFTDMDGSIYKDDIGNFKLLRVEHVAGKLCFLAKRPLRTCGKFDYQIDRGTTHVISFSLPHFNYLNQGLQSINVSVQRLQLIKSEIPPPKMPKDMTEFVIGVDKVMIPNVETTYWCKTILLPKLKEKHHIIRYEGVITPSSVGIIHHMEVFHCQIKDGEVIREYNAPCNSETKPMGLQMCRKVIGAWAMGASGITFPKEAGSPIGGPGFSRYVIVEIHYNNPQRKAGLIDNSGIRFFITRQLRHFDAGIMELGLEYNSKNSIPPRQSNFRLSGICNDQCTRQAIPTTGINVFASQLHTHLTGRQVTTYRIREGKFVTYVNRDIHYSPHFQEIRRLPKLVQIEPGDTLITTCTYDTRNRSQMTFGGLAITDEMCVNYIHYYPRIDLEVCKSSVADQELIAFFNWHKLETNELNDATIRSNFNQIRWSKMNLQAIKSLYNFMPLHMSCNTSSGHEINSYNWSYVRQNVFENEVHEAVDNVDWQCYGHK